MRYSVILLVLFIVGVVGASPVNAAGGPCALLTKAEVQEASGVTVAEGVVNTTNKSVCDYRVGAGGSGIGIMLTDKGAADSAEKMVAGLAKSKISAKVVPGIGDGAYASSPGYGMQQFGAFKGSKHVIATVMLIGAPEAKAKDAAEKVIRKAVGKL
jgi:hypothetical protein